MDTQFIESVSAFAGQHPCFADMVFKKFGNAQRGPEYKSSSDDSYLHFEQDASKIKEDVHYAWLRETVDEVLLGTRRLQSVKAFAKHVL